MSEAIITVQNLGKKYSLRHLSDQRYVALRDVLAEKATGLFRRNRRNGQQDGGTTRPQTSKEEFWALKDISFDVKQGEVVGIIGRNGAGKSTLLKILSRITDPTEGKVRISGRVASLLEVGTGFHPELTGRENIFLNGAILGMGRAEIKAKFDEMVAFAETEKFLDTPVKRYSSGMYVRLAFAVAAHLEPEILIVDEVLAVGDAKFQKKSLGKMRDVSQTGRTVLFVSHNMAAVQSLCGRGLLLENGKVRFDGDIQSTIEQYAAHAEGKSNSLEGISQRTGNGAARLVRCNCVSRASVDSSHEGGGRIAVEISYEASSAAQRMQILVGIYDYLQTRVLFLDSNAVNGLPETFPKSGTISIKLNQSFRLYPGSYTLNLALIVNEEMADYIQGAATLLVEEEDFFHTGRLPSAKGMVLVEQQWSLVE